MIGLRPERRSASFRNADRFQSGIVIGFDPGLGGTSEGVPDNRRYGRGNCASSDQRQVVNLSAVAQTPNFGRLPLRLPASGWQISPIMNIKSAQLFTVTSGSDDALTGLTGQRPNQIVADPYAPNQSVDHWLLPATVAFARPAPGTYGNAPFNSLKGSGVFQFDMALSRTFVFKERNAAPERLGGRSGDISISRSPVPARNAALS